jgi:hypothetical protein
MAKTRDKKIAQHIIAAAAILEEMSDKTIPYDADEGFRQSLEQLELALDLLEIDDDS